MKAKKCLVSACLLGFCTRYDGAEKESLACRRYINKHDLIWLPVCPEQLGGLPTPREAADIMDGNGKDVLAGRGKVVTKGGIDVTQEFVQGAEMILSIARKQNISLALLKSRSPSCGVDRRGVTASLLLDNGVECLEFG